MAKQDILVPDLGEFSDVAVVEILVKPGDTVEVETGLITLETDKATMDVPSPLAGKLVALHVNKGDLVSTGTLLATVETEGEAAAETASASPPTEPEPASSAAPAKEPAAPASTSPGTAQGGFSGTDGGASAAPAGSTGQAAAPSPAKPVAPAPAAPPAAASGDADFRGAHAGPSVRALARELGVDLPRVTGTGRKGRITHEDVRGFVKSVMTATASGTAGGGSLPTVPAVDFRRFGEVEVVPVGRIQRIAGPRLHASWVNIPHVTQVDEADVTELEEARRWLKLQAAAEGFSLTAMAFVLRACVLALREFPRFNASLDTGGQNLVLKKYCHLGFAVDTEGGLVVPVIRDADRKDVFTLARELGELSGKARDGKLGAADIQGGCFTVSNLGGIGGTAFTPIINAPEVAVLGVSRSAWKPVWDGEAFVPRRILPLSLSYDHRVIDGADGARFAGFVAKALGDVERLMAREA